MWGVYDRDCAPPHVVPLNDLVEHEVNDFGSCICQPTLRRGVLVHHSLDGREFNEKGYKGPAMPKEG